MAIIGCGTIGRIRGMLAKEFPGISWIGLCDIREDLGRKLAEDVGADFFTTDFSELISRPDVTATIIGTDENVHYAPTMAADGHRNLILTMAMDLSAKLGRPVELPVDIAELGN